MVYNFNPLSPILLTPENTLDRSQENRHGPIRNKPIDRHNTNPFYQYNKTVKDKGIEKISNSDELDDDLKNTYSILKDIAIKTFNVTLDDNKCVLEKYFFIWNMEQKLAIHVTTVNNQNLEKLKTLSKKAHKMGWSILTLSKEQLDKVAESNENILSVIYNNSNTNLQALYELNNNRNLIKKIFLDNKEMELLESRNILNIFNVSLIDSQAPQLQSHVKDFNSPFSDANQKLSQSNDILTSTTNTTSSFPFPQPQSIDDAYSHTFTTTTNTTPSFLFPQPQSIDDDVEI